MQIIDVQESMELPTNVLGEKYKQDLSFHGSHLGMVHRMEAQKPPTPIVESKRLFEHWRTLPDRIGSAPIASA
jgi:hypothetical protein